MHDCLCVGGSQYLYKTSDAVHLSLTVALRGNVKMSGMCRCIYVCKQKLIKHRI